MNFDIDFNHPKMRAAAATLVEFGADKQKQLSTEDAKDRKAVNAAVDAFWKKAPLEARRAFLAQLAGYASERSAERLVRFGQKLTKAGVAPSPTPAALPASPEVNGKTDASKTP